LEENSMAEDTTLPIKQLTLYKHGVAFVQRRGVVSGTDVRLAFRADEVNDALKSLLAIDHRGGHVLGIHYDTPADSAALLAERRLNLRDNSSLLDLLRGLRGWNVRIVAGDGAQQETISGRLIGVDVPQDEAGRRPVAVVVENAQSGAITNLPVTRVREVFLLEERARQDLQFVLDISRTEAVRRTIGVRLSEGEHDLSVSYLVPSPVWRVSYRLVAERGTDGTQAGDGGTLLVQGWGLFDNRFEEDLDEVRVQFVAGQPISFVYDLATSHIPERPVVEDQARVAPGPVEFEESVRGITAAPRGRAMYKMAMASDAVTAGAAMPAAMRAPSMEEMAQQPIAATGEERGELFQYTVAAPVTVKRGESTLVPILGATLPYQRELLFNEGKLPKHPVTALRFRNTSGLVLERGPVTIIEDGAYHGEAMVPFTKEGGEVYLAYGVELSIDASSTLEWSDEWIAFRIEKGMLWSKRANIRRMTYRFQNNLADARTVVLEHTRLNNYELTQMPEPDSTTATTYRWSVPCAAGEATTFEVVERHYVWESSAVLDQGYSRLRDVLAGGWLEGAALEVVNRLLERQSTIARNNEELERLRVEREDIYRHEEQLRSNMAALGSAGDEGNLRKRVVGQLEQAEGRLGEIAARTDALKAENDRLQREIDAELATLTVAETATPGGAQYSGSASRPPTKRRGR
jgi:hypothetical protein